THAPAVEAIVRRYSAAPMFYAKLKFESLSTLTVRQQGDAQAGAPRSKLFAFCAIGNPSAFFDDLREWGLPAVGHTSFPDHHKYSNADVERIEAQARATGADALVCTAKDAMNLHGLAFRTLPLWVCNVSLDVRDADGFWRAAGEILSRRRPEIAL